MSHRTIINLVALMALAMASGLAEAGTRIYKSVDADGNIVFTDVPPPEEGISQEVNVGASNTFTTPETRSEGLQVYTGRQDEEASDVTEFAYNQAIIVAPTNDAALRDNAGNVSVKTRVSPALRPGHLLRLLVDETPLGRPISASEFALSNVDRGTHTMGLQIVNQAGETIFDGPRTTFHLQRASVGAKPRPTPN